MVVTFQKNVRTSYAVSKDHDKDGDPLGALAVDLLAGDSGVFSIEQAKTNSSERAAIFLTRNQMAALRVVIDDILKEQA